MRYASSRVLMKVLWKAGAKVQAYEPEATEEAQRIYGCRDDLNLCGTKEAPLKGADALLIITAWPVVCGMPEAFTDGEEGRVAPIDNAAAQAKLILAWSNSWQLMGRGSLAVRNRYFLKFEINTVGSAFLNLQCGAS